MHLQVVALLGQSLDRGLLVIDGRLKLRLLHVEVLKKVVVVNLRIVKLIELVLYLTRVALCSAKILIIVLLLLLLLLLLLILILLSLV